MGRALRGIGTPANLSLSGASTIGEGTRYVFGTAHDRWGFQVVTTSTQATITLQGSVATSSDATGTTLGTWVATTSDQTTGETIFVVDKPVMQVWAQLDSASSSGVSAWIAGV